MKALMIFPSLMLVKPSKKSRAKEERIYLKKRLQMWDKGEIRQLREEAEALQLRLATRKTDTPSNDQPITRRFGYLLRKGKVKDAEDSQRPFRSTDLLDGKPVIEILHEKHPNGKDVQPSALSETSQEDGDFHPIVFEGINASLICASALKASGSTGPSGFNAREWRHICTSYNPHSDELCSHSSCY